MSVIESFLSVVFNSSTSILFAALGILLMHLSGVINIGAEGMMLIGAFSGVVGSHLTGNVWLGGLFAMVVTGFVGMVYGYCTITYKGNQVVIGIAFNILAQGITTTLYRILFGMNSNTMKVDSFSKLGVLSMPVYLSILAVIVMTVFLNQTKPGLKVRGAGEYPQAIDSMGISVNLTRYISVVAGSMIIGFGGAYLSLGQLSFFTENMTDGRGYIGMSLFRPFVGSGQTVDRNDLLRHMDYILELGGEDTLAMGTDFDGCDGLFPEGITGVEAVPFIACAMRESHFGEALVEKIMFRNAWDFWRNNLPPD